MSDENLRVPAFCPICEMLMRSSRSTRTYYDFGCCMHCYIEFVEDREERWRAGWRPSADDLRRFFEKNGLLKPTNALPTPQEESGDGKAEGR